MDVIANLQWFIFRYLYKRYRENLPILCCKKVYLFTTPCFIYRRDFGELKGDPRKFFKFFEGFRRILDKPAASALYCFYIQKVLTETESPHAAQRTGGLLQACERREIPALPEPADENRPVPRVKGIKAASGLRAQFGWYHGSKPSSQSGRRLFIFRKGDTIR